MESRLRLLTITCAVVFLAGVVAAFTVDGDDGDLASADSPTTTAGDDVDTDGSTTTAKPKGGSGGGDDASTTTTTEAGSSSTTTAAPASSTTTTVATTTTAQTTTTQPERTPTTPGTYTYTVNGCCDRDGNQINDGQSTLTVSEVDGEGRQTHNQRGADGESTTVYRYAAEGRYLESMTVDAQGFTLTLNATSPFLIIPADAQKGTVTTGQLKGDGLTADVTFTLLELGSSTSKARIDADISGRVANTCDVDGTMTSTISARSRDQLPIDTHAVSDMNATGGLFCPGKITSDVRSVLQQ